MNKGNLDRIWILIFFLKLPFKNLFQSSRDYSFICFISEISNHCVCLTSSRLPISKYCPIEPFEHWVQNWLCCFLIYLFLNWLNSKNCIKSKLSFVSFFFNNNWSRFFVKISDNSLRFLLICQFFLWKRAKTNIDLNSFFCGFSFLTFSLFLLFGLWNVKFILTLRILLTIYILILLNHSSVRSVHLNNRVFNLDFFVRLKSLILWSVCLFVSFL